MILRQSVAVPSQSVIAWPTDSGETRGVRFSKDEESESRSPNVHHRAINKDDYGGCGSVRWMK